MSTNRHWTPRSGFFPCAAKGNCPKQDQHYAPGNTASELKSTLRTAEREARTSMLNGDINAAQYHKVVNQVRNETTSSLKALRVAEKTAKDDEKPKKKFISTSLRRSVATFTGAAILVGSLSACGATVAQLPDNTSSEKDSNSVIQTLNEAESINLNKSVISWGDHWDVTADQEQAAELKGQAVAVLGDTYSMYSNDGNLVASEAEKVVTLLPSATTYDYNNAERGSIEQNFSPILNTYKIKDVKGNTIGTAEQNLSLTLNFDIKNADGEVEYTVKKAMVSWGSSLDIERQVENPEVDAQDAIWISVIANELASSSSSKSSSK
jgi:uncharacterized protein YxjI